MNTDLTNKLKNYISQNKRNYRRAKIELSDEIVWNSLRELGKAFVSEHFKLKEHKDIYKKLKLYFCNDPAFEDLKPYRFNGKAGDMKLDKGILLAGNPGTGKTDAIRLFLKFLHFAGRPIDHRHLNAKDAEKRFQQDGYKILAPLRDKKVYFIDDIGQESMANYYGKDENVMETALTYRYEVYKSTRVPTLSTTNLSPDMYIEKYGEPVAERIFEMFNIFAMTGKSLRR